MVTTVRNKALMEIRGYTLEEVEEFHLVYDDAVDKLMNLFTLRGAPDGYSRSMPTTADRVELFLYGSPFHAYSMLTRAHYGRYMPPEAHIANLIDAIAILPIEYRDRAIEVNKYSKELRALYDTNRQQAPKANNTNTKLKDTI